MAGVSSVYLATHRATGSVYVGWTSLKPAQRWSIHWHEAIKRGRPYHFYNALRAYGRDAFTWEVVKTFETQEEAKAAEVALIAELTSRGVRLSRAKFVGSNHHTAKLNENDVKYIRSSPLSGEELAVMFGVKHNTISNIRLHKTWKHVV
jgi:GIY-YIG catalytic domain